MRATPPPLQDSAVDRRLLAALTIAAFLSPGAWMVITLPPQPVAQFLHLATAAAWLGFVVCKRRALTIDRRILLALAAVLAVSLVSLLAGAYPLQQLLYDLYGEMPGMLWLAFPAVFVAASSVRFVPSAMRSALAAAGIVGVGLIAVMALWRWNVGLVTTFGSPAYSIPALAPVPFLALGVAAVMPERRRWYIGVAIASALGLAYAGGGLSALFMLAMGVVVTLAIAPELLGLPGAALKPVRIAGGGMLALALVVLLVVQVPLVGSSIVGVDDAAGAEQTVATRLYLWDAAQKMLAERPLIGFGPAGYRFSAVEFYEPGVFAYLAGAGSDPTAYSAPSPHSLLWEVATRLGLLGLTAFVALLVLWALRVRALAAQDPSEDRPLRLAMAVGFIAYLASLMVTPVHFASGLLGVVLAGFAITRVPETKAPEPAMPKVQTVALVLSAAILVAYGGWRMAGLTAGAIGGAGDLEADAARVESAARIIPGEPLNERRLLEVRMWLAQTPQELDAQRAAVDAAPGYVTGYAPNLVQFASIGMSRAERFGVADLGWEQTLLQRVEADLPDLSSLVAEQLRLAVLQGNVEKLPGLIERAEQLGQTYPPTQGYVERARALLDR